MEEIAMSGRLDIIDNSQTVGTPQAIPAKHPLNGVVVSLVLTEKNGPGSPSMKLIPLRGTADVLAEKPTETVTLTDEQGQKVDHKIEYAAGAVTGADLVANTSADGVLMKMQPLSVADKHEPGLVVRLGYQIEGLNAGRMAGAADAKHSASTAKALLEEETRLREWLDVIADFERVKFPMAK
jgi:hypothetical protein